ncbi:hypothetical protein UB37_00880 [Photobacterium iliopiscarium]|jgi:hypothetical protein|uniref:Uncharacterized protein n=1 Tax=Photobacterium iliopiscarium TaxID=56192 RepID=A0ABX5GXN6_9GAMM|nr:hypothetical protein [Photobacterium iliopiscarium]KJG26505.1 hypothetical protein UB37_00880 [Photobacterium iliopiscarium]PSW99559.1 hypothetical protein C9J52_01885 [Photobacterium iliopiscarium]
MKANQRQLFKSMYRAKRLLRSGVINYDLMSDIHCQFKANESINSDVLKYCYLCASVALIDREAPDKLVESSQWRSLFHFEGLPF